MDLGPFREVSTVEPIVSPVFDEEPLSEPAPAPAREPVPARAPGLRIVPLPSRRGRAGASRSWPAPSERHPLP